MSNFEYTGYHMPGVELIAAERQNQLKLQHEGSAAALTVIDAPLEVRMLVTAAASIAREIDDILERHQPS